MLGATAKPRYSVRTMKSTHVSGDAAVDRLRDALAPLRQQLLTHPLYHAIETRDDLARFMELHVFAVWDFMSLLKRLQRDLTGVGVPWLPPRNAACARLINELVLAEESDLLPGRATPTSHFELYVEAMHEVGASPHRVRELLAALAHGSWHAALAVVPDGARPFVTLTLTTAVERPLHEVAASFLFGREDPIPGMFGRIVESIEEAGMRCPTLRSYLERHIALDENTHAPLALKMLRELCGDDADRWREAESAARRAIEARLALWDAASALRRSDRFSQTAALEPPSAKSSTPLM
ncbi:MAG: heme oxygenase [bacterium]|nr:heme oxygenase [bacterium]